MISIIITAAERSKESHRLLSERILQVVAETYCCAEAEIVLAIVDKPVERFGEDLSGSCTKRGPLAAEHRPSAKKRIVSEFAYSGPGKRTVLRRCLRNRMPQQACGAAGK